MRFIEKAIIASVIAVPIFFFIYLTINNQIFGVDSWYWLKFGFQSIKLDNILMVGMWFFPLMLFTLFPNSKRSGLLIGAFFLLNLFSLRFLEVELDDYVMYFGSFLAIFWLKIKFPEKNFHKIFAVCVVAGYILYHSIFLSFGSYSSTIYIENLKNPANLFIILFTLYLLANNKKWKWFIFLAIYTILLPTGKMLSNPLPILVFALYLDFLTDKEFRFDKYDKYILIFFLVSFLVWYIRYPIKTVSDNNYAFKTFCNPETKICNNTDIEYWDYGHYFAWLGYKSSNQLNYGEMCCEGAECLNQTAVH